VLTLTATPIPRTLAMSMEGIRDFSVIATAPQKRLAIKTFVRRESDGTIREALLRELKRGGQVYFLHNEVETIGNRRQALEALVPEARIVVAHGQMPERELERVMRDFHQQRFNVLLCTTIIETGIDVPSANTIVMHRADKLRTGPAAPAAWPRRALASPGVRVSADPRRERDHQGCHQAARSDPDDGGAGLRLLSGDARPRDPRCR
jgi:hypothetical protein